MDRTFKTENFILQWVFWTEHFIDELEDSLTGAPTGDTKIEVLAVDVENKFDKDITAGPKFSKMNEPIDEIEIDLKE